MFCIFPLMTRSNGERLYAIKALWETLYIRWKLENSIFDTRTF